MRAFTEYSNADWWAVSRTWPTEADCDLDTFRALVERNAGVKKAAASFDEGEARVLYDAEATNEEQLVAAVEKAGYRVTGRTAG